MEEVKGRWAEELLGVLWAYRTTKRQLIGETPFSLTYAMEVVIPSGLRKSIVRTATVDAGNNNQHLSICLDFLEEKREKAQIRIVVYH